MSISIPDTIIYSFDEPVCWYFTWFNIIKKKNKNKLTNEIVSNKFLKNVPKSGIVAGFFYKIENPNEKTRVIFEYYDEIEFSNKLEKKLLIIIFLI